MPNHSITNRLRLLVHPPPEIGKVDTSLRYTDILFGFVIKELFVRLQNWPALDAAVRWQLCVGTVLVLCSWIGFRRSLNRTSYEVKFFNLPLMKFVTDQLMLILYFRLAVISGTDGTTTYGANDLTEHTIRLLAYVFGLYAVWDALGVWMCYAKRREGSERVPRYPLIENDPETSKPVMTEKPQVIDWNGFGITITGGIALCGVWILSRTLNWQAQMLSAVAILLAYRLAKEIRTSWRNL